MCSSCAMRALEFHAIMQEVMSTCQTCKWSVRVPCNHTKQNVSFLLPCHSTNASCGRSSSGADGKSSFFGGTNGLARPSPGWNPNSNKQAKKSRMNQSRILQMSHSWPPSQAAAACWSPCRPPSGPCCLSASPLELEDTVALEASQPPKRETTPACSCGRTNTTTISQATLTISTASSSSCSGSGSPSASNGSSSSSCKRYCCRGKATCHYMYVCVAGMHTTYCKFRLQVQDMKYIVSSSTASSTYSSSSSSSPASCGQSGQSGGSSSSCTYHKSSETTNFKS